MPGEVRTAAAASLATTSPHRGFGRELMQQLRDGRKTLGEALPIVQRLGTRSCNVHGVDEAEQMPPVAANAREGVEGFGAWWFVEALLHQFGIAENRSERGSKLVAHVGHELEFVLARDLKRAPLLDDLIERACIFKRDRRFFSETLHEADDGSMELAWPPASKDERAERFVRSGR